MHILNKPLPKYYDSAATTPVHGDVLKAMLPYFSELFGNASSNHIYGKQAKTAIDQARHQVANIINAEDNEVYFTSGATEAINWALKGYLEANPEKGNHIITVKTEHKAVLNTCEYLETKGYEVTYLDVDKNGLISLGQLKESIKPATSIISVMPMYNCDVKRFISMDQLPGSEVISIRYKNNSENFTPFEDFEPINFNENLDLELNLVLSFNNGKVNQILVSKHFIQPEKVEELTKN